ncbi:MAG: GNAT family N-acetyltransferase [Synechococcaceae cyanobacterium]|nr:GNAT family N-acetyltransferase [Synechococcaceae cyanobacterium]
MVRHGPLRLRLRLRLADLSRLFDEHSFWAQGRSRQELRRMLVGSQVVISAWQDGVLVGFGRASSDGVFRGVLWDVVVAEPLRGRGLGRRLVSALLASPALRRCERVYLMTTSSSGFYRRLGFCPDHGQHLLVWRRDPGNKTSG